MQQHRTYPVEVPGVGNFVFRRRVLRDQVGIEAEAIRILGGPTEDKGLQSTALALATLAALTVTAPDEWDLDNVDPLDDEAVARVFQVYGRLRQAEDDFRRGSKPERPAVGA